MHITKKINFLQYVLDKLEEWGNVYSHRMFGGAALYHEGLAFAMLMNDTIYLN